jgi:hypothetical protein
MYFNKFKGIIILSVMFGICAVHYIFQEQENLVTVLSIGIKYVSISPCEIELHKSNYGVQNIYNMGVQFFLCQRAISLTWSVLRAARESIIVDCISKYLN